MIREQQAGTKVQPAIKMSFQDYLKAYDSVEGIQTEWIAGEVAIYPISKNRQHQGIIQFLTVLLNLFLRMKSLGTLLLDGFPMYLGDERPARERIKATHLDGRADIVIEMVSPESSERDRGAKLDEYEAAGVLEYWLFDPLRTEARIYALGDDGRYHPVDTDAQGRLVSPLLPGFALNPALLWADELPSGMAVVALAQAMTAGKSWSNSQILPC